MIAGGIGITPMRALFKQMEQHNSRKAILIYSSKDGYLFKDELEAIAEKDSNISVIYTINREEMQQKISDEVKAHGPDAYYYISGSPKMIKGTKSDLKEHGVSGSRVVTDPFVGY
jgi:NAD(P)H-flavin reductase